MSFEFNIYIYSGHSDKWNWEDNLISRHKCQPQLPLAAPNLSKMPNISSGPRKQANNQVCQHEYDYNVDESEDRAEYACCHALLSLLDLFPLPTDLFGVIGGMLLERVQGNILGHDSLRDLTGHE